jgi:hypothetical protein
LPLEPLISHIDSLIDRTRESEDEIDVVPYSKIKSMLLHAIENYRNGLEIAKDGLALSLIKKAEIIAETKPKSGIPQSTEQILYTIYRENLSTTYSTVERLNTDVTMFTRTEIAPELYHWLCDIPESLNVQKVIVLREGERFLTQTFEQLITNPLRFLIRIAEKPEVSRNSFAQVKPLDLLKMHPIQEGYVVSCIRGESGNPVMWPILCHEMFELVDLAERARAEENSIFKKFVNSVSEAGEEMPALDPVPETNELYVLEILMDFLAMNSFGPMYAKSLLEYCKRSPYYKTPQYPEMCDRLFCAYLHLHQSFEGELDIFGKCKKKAMDEISPEISRYEQNKELDKEKKDKLTRLFKLMIHFLPTIKTPSFIDRLKYYAEEAVDSNMTLEKLVQSEDEFIPFKDPLMSFDDIKNNILFHHIALAIDPNIVLNVVLANYDLYREEKHLSVLLDGIKKWKVKQAWNRSAEAIASKKKGS